MFVESGGTAAALQNDAYFSGVLNAASPRMTSAYAQYIRTWAT